MVLVEAREVEAADVLVVAVGVVDQQWLELVDRVGRGEPHRLDAVEHLLVVHVGDGLEHGTVAQVVTVDDGLLVDHAGRRVLAVHEDLAAQRPLALGALVQVGLVVVGLVDREVDDGAGNLDPRHGVAVDLAEAGPVHLRRDGRVVVGDHGVLGELLVLDVLAVVLPLRLGPHAGGAEHQGKTHDEQHVGNDAQRAAVLVLAVALEVVRVGLAEVRRAGALVAAAGLALGLGLGDHRDEAVGVVVGERSLGRVRGARHREALALVLFAHVDVAPSGPARAGDVGRWRPGFTPRPCRASCSRSSRARRGRRRRGSGLRRWRRSLRR